jgi:hypothetical protein
MTSVTIRSFILSGLLGIFICAFTGCATQPVKAKKETSVSDDTRNNSYSLLYQLLEQEKDVSILRLIKHENKDLKDLIKRVAAAAREGGKQLDEFAKKDPSLDLKDIALPPGEDKTRDAIGDAKQKLLLHDSGSQFEITLLLTQIEALNYGAYLAKVAAANDFQPKRADYLNGLSVQLLSLHDQVMARLALAPKAAESH